MVGAGALVGLTIVPEQESIQGQEPQAAAVEHAVPPVRVATASVLPALPALAPADARVEASSVQRESPGTGRQQFALATPLPEQHVFLEHPAPAPAVGGVPEPAVGAAPALIVADVPLPRSRPADAPPATPEATGITLASASSTVVDLPRQITHPKKVGRDESVLNDAQIASIKAKLNLTPEQERYWPAVEVALRRIAWDSKQLTRQKKSVRPGEGPAIDMNGAGVAQLKSAAFPLVMSFSEDQKDEVRKFAHLIGLSKLAQEF
jgi:hypothetical protein